MGIFQDTLERTLEEAAMARPDISDERLAELTADTVMKCYPKIAELVWQSMDAAKEEMLFHHRLEMETFTKRNIFRWREGLDLMEALAVASLEIGQMAKGEDGTGDPPLVDTKQNVLLRLHAKALQIFGEVVCLLKHGYADGALGRWRVLHETAVVASLISAHDEGLAQRFLDFRFVESWKRMKVYQHNAQRLGEKPFPPQEMDEARKRFEGVMTLHGPDFDGNYGWASSVVKTQGKEVSFRDIERAVGITHLKPYYQWACEKIHIGCNAVHKSLGLVHDHSEEIMVAGPSNAGLCDPAHLSAISLHQATCCLNTVFPSMDVLVGCKITETLVAKIGEAFLKAHQQLEQEEGNQRRQVCEAAEDFAEDAE